MTVRRVVIVSTVELDRAAVAELVPRNAEVVVVVPAVEQSRLQWLTNEEDAARRHAAARAEQIGEETENTVATVVGDPDPLLAVKDALRTFDADEILVVGRSGEDATWLERGGLDELSRQIDGVRVRSVSRGPQPSDDASTRS